MQCKCLLKWGTLCISSPQSNHPPIPNPKDIPLCSQLGHYTLHEALRMCFLADCAHLMHTGFYQVFVVTDKGVYSRGRWVQLRGPWNAVPVGLRSTASYVEPAASSNFDNGTSKSTWQLMHWRMHQHSAQNN